jgi:hypothetical protein
LLNVNAERDHISHDCTPGSKCHSQREAWLVSDEPLDGRKLGADKDIET